MNLSRMKGFVLAIRKHDTINCLKRILTILELYTEDIITITYITKSSVQHTSSLMILMINIDETS